MECVDIDTLHDFLLKTGDIEELGVRSKIDCEAGKHQIQDCQTHKKETDAVFVGLIKRTLGFDHASESEISCAFPRLLRVFVHASHALITHVQC